MADNAIDIPQPRARPYAALADSQEAAEEDSHTVVIGSCISECVIARSGLLSGLGGTEGLASLPCRVSPDDFRLWEAACLVGSDYRCATDELVTIVKVADAISDTECSTWLEKLTSRALSAEWQQPQEGNDMLAALLRLPLHLFHHVLSSCLTKQSASKLLTTFPPALHPSLVSIAAEQEKLTVRYGDAPTLLPHLMTPPATGPGQLQQLFLGESTILGKLMRVQDRNVDGESPMSTSVGALLGRAASSHPSLTLLHLGPQALPPQWLRNFSGCLSPGALPRLQDLTLTVDGESSGCAEVATCLRLLPALTSLSVSFHLPEGPPPPAESLAAFARLAATPAALPTLQRLYLADDVHGLMEEAEAPVSVHRSYAFAILSLLGAPAVTELELTVYGDPPSLPPLVAQLLSFPAVQKVEINSSVLFPDRPKAEIGSGDKHLAALADVTVHSSCARSAVGIAAALAALAQASLTSFALCPHSSGPRYGVEEDSTAATVCCEWQQLSPALSRCTSLKDLTLKCLGCAPDTKAQFSNHIAAAVEPLVQLTALRLLPMLTDFELPLDGRVISGGLSSLTALGQLVFADVMSNVFGSPDWPGRLQLDSVQPMLDVCRQLTRLSRLELYLATGGSATLDQICELLENNVSLKDVAFSLDLDDADEFERNHIEGQLGRRFPAVTFAVC